MWKMLDYQNEKSIFNIIVLILFFLMYMMSLIAIPLVSIYVSTQVTKTLGICGIIVFISIFFNWLNIFTVTKISVEYTSKLIEATILSGDMFRTTEKKFVSKRMQIFMYTEESISVTEFIKLFMTKVLAFKNFYISPSDFNKINECEYVYIKNKNGISMEFEKSNFLEYMIKCIQNKYKNDGYELNKLNSILNETDV